jgi:Hypoxia induced protein conserved region
MIKNKDHVPVVVTGNKARAGVTGHNVRYVLAFGLAGSIIAFVVIELYFYYSKLAQTISQTSSRIDPVAFLSYAIPFALAAVATVLLLGLWNMIMPRASRDTSQTLMRWRVVLQFIALCLVMVALYLSGKH